MTLRLHEPSREDWVAAMGADGPERDWAVWAEGYAATGERAGAHLMGRARATSFVKACDAVMAKDPEAPRYFNAERLSYWGCRLFPIESDARVAFG